MTAAQHPVLSLPPAEVIDQTQRDMREVALNATPDPWPPTTILGSDGTSQGTADLTHIVAWTPTVALAVAELLGAALPYARNLLHPERAEIVTDALQVCHEWWATRPVPTKESAR